MPDATPAPMPRFRFFLTDLVALMLLVLAHLSFLFGFTQLREPQETAFAAFALTFLAVIGWYTSIRLWSRFNPVHPSDTAIAPNVSLLERIAHSIAYEILLIAIAPFFFAALAIMIAVPVLLLLVPLCACLIIAAKRSAARKIRV